MCALSIGGDAVSSIIFPWSRFPQFQANPSSSAQNMNSTPRVDQDGRMKEWKSVLPVRLLDEVLDQRSQFPVTQLLSAACEMRELPDAVIVFLSTANRLTFSAIACLQSRSCGESSPFAPSRVPCEVVQTTSSISPTG